MFTGFRHPFTICPWGLASSCTRCQKEGEGKKQEDTIFLSTPLSSLFNPIAFNFHSRRLLVTSFSALMRCQVEVTPKTEWEVDLQSTSEYGSYYVLSLCASRLSLDFLSL